MWTLYSVLTLRSIALGSRFARPKDKLRNASRRVAVTERLPMLRDARAPLASSSAWPGTTRNTEEIVAMPPVESFRHGTTVKPLPPALRKICAFSIVDFFQRLQTIGGKARCDDGYIFTPRLASASTVLSV